MEPSNSDALVWLGRTCEKLNKLDDAKKHYERAVNLPNITNVHAYFYFGVFCEKKRDFRKAIQLLKTCLQIDKKHIGACIHLA